MWKQKQVSCSSKITPFDGINETEDLDTYISQTFLRSISLTSHIKPEMFELSACFFKIHLVGVGTMSPNRSRLLILNAYGVKWNPLKHFFDLLHKNARFCSFLAYFWFKINSRGVPLLLGSAKYVKSTLHRNF